MAFDADVVVVGAGPVGCAMATALASRGVDVLVVERGQPGRDKVCGEGLMPHGVAAARRLGLPIEGPEFRGIRYVVGATSAEGTFPDGGVGIGLRRTTSDARLLRATEAVARVLLGVKVTGLEGQGGDLRVRTDQQVLRCRLVVAADGARSGIRKAAGLDAVARGRRRWAVRQHHGWLGPMPERVEVHLLADSEVYLTPVGDGLVNVALLLEDDQIGAFRGDRGAELARRVARSGLAHRLGAPVGDASATGPLRQQARDVVGDGVMLVGDASGFVDGITGEGMSLGLVGAEVAAEVAAGCLRTGRLSANDLGTWARRQAALVRDSRRLTEVVLAGVVHRRLAAAVVGQLARRSALFDHLLAVDTGQASLTGLLDLRRWTRQSPRYLNYAG
jgi:flavin-dependent dehydrogenase